MKPMKWKRKGNQIVITRKLDKCESINPIELDIVKKNEISALLPLDSAVASEGRRLQFFVPNFPTLAAYLRSGILFGVFLRVVQQVVEVIRACEAQGVFIGNLELQAECMFFDPAKGAVQMLYWPLLSLTRENRIVNFFLELGELHTANPADQPFQLEYFRLFDSRAEFDLMRFEKSLELLQEKWHVQRRLQKEETIPMPCKHPVPFSQRFGRRMPSLLRVKTNTQIILQKFPFTLGRQSELCDYMIDNNPYVGRKHLTLAQQGRSVFVCDNGSVNGTKLDGQAVPPNRWVELSSGCALEVGREVFFYFAAGDNQ